MAQFEEEKKILDTCSTFVDVLKYHADVRPDKVLLTWVDDDGNDGASFTFRQLLERATSLAYKMQTAWKFNRGDRIILMYPPGMTICSQPTRVSLTQITATHALIVFKLTLCFQALISLWHSLLVSVVVLLLFLSIHQTQVCLLGKAHPHIFSGATRAG